MFDLCQSPVAKLPRILRTSFNHVQASSAQVMIRSFTFSTSAFALHYLFPVLAAAFHSCAEFRQTVSSMHLDINHTERN